MSVSLKEFMKESLSIEGINREPTDAEMDVTVRFLKLPEIRVLDLVGLTRVYQPAARLRNRGGLDIQIGNHFPEKGGPAVEVLLDSILYNMAVLRLNPYTAHIKYESLHPFTDGNGRSGRTLWLWHMGWFAEFTVKFDYLPRSFLHEFYYQSLREGI